MSVDFVGDYLTKIRNAVIAKKNWVLVNGSKVTINITKILEDAGFIESYSIIDDERGFSKINIKLKYVFGGDPVLNTLKRISKPGRRVYVGVDNIPRVLNGLGIAVLSTSKGVMNDKKAVESGVGGELLCIIY